MYMCSRISKSTFGLKLLPKKVQYQRFCKDVLCHEYMHIHEEAKQKLQYCSNNLSEVLKINILQIIFSVLEIISQESMKRFISSNEIYF